jgi:glutamyl/glutaminyl-tRNA synthetase
MSAIPSPLITRFAPSPTGHLHIGGARSALFCWAFAKSMARVHNIDGRFMIRIEDTDQARSSEESARGILDDLAWLGICWDDGPSLTTTHGQTIGGDSRKVGPYFQAQRVAIYNAYLEHLVRLGRAYPAFETTEELDAKRKAATAAKQTYKYARPEDVKFGEFNQARWARAQAGERHVIRFAMPDTAIVVHDQILGDVTSAAGEVDDFVIRKADGFPTYHFAVVIDDELMGVTHVMRAQEHLSNTPKHVAMQQALTRLVDDRSAASGSNGTRFRTPAYGHMPLIFNADGTKMSKRDKAKAARKALKDAMAKDKALTAAAIGTLVNLPEKTITDFLAAETDAVEIAETVAPHFNVLLPEIEIWDFRRSGYLPEVITNFIALLGWSTGMKQADGKDVEKFDMAFLAQHFSIDRIGKTSAKFDRVKLASFNADAIQAMTDEQFWTRWTAWLTEFTPDVAEKLKSFAHADRQPARHALVQAIKPRAKTLSEGHRSIGFALIADDAVTFDPAAVDKALRGVAQPADKAMPPSGKTGVDVLRALRTVLAAQTDYSPAAIDGLIPGFATEHKLAMGSVAQPLRVALTGSTVSPGVGHCCAILGKAGTLARIDRCLSIHTGN